MTTSPLSGVGKPHISALPPTTDVELGFSHQADGGSHKAILLENSKPRAGVCLRAQGSFDQPEFSWH